MLQTDRKTTEPARQNAREQERAQQRKKQDLDAQAEAAATLQAILAGGSREQLPAEGMLALSHTLGNGALLELLALRPAGPETEGMPLPDAPCLTGPLPAPGGAPQWAAAPDFGGMAPMPASAPLAV
jgi:hypothetical protein